jgi:peptidoglycan/xylan/chitin deacetylase (PgdA/CDA1 family)
MGRKLACITLDVEADYDNPQKRLRMFEDGNLMERFVSIINRHGAKVTAFLVTSLIEKYEGSLRQFGASIPVEFAVHSHAHDMQNACNRDDIRQAVEVFQSFTGQAPAGYRAPVGMINREGLETLLDLGFRYDSSIYPAIRPGRLGYWNLHMPTEPFRVVRGSDSLVEIPFSTLPTIRLVFSLSYVKLLGWGTYATLMNWFPPPKVSSVLSHPHDFYFHLVAQDVQGLDRHLLMKDARKAYDLFDNMLGWLEAHGYEFVLMREACASLEKIPELPQRSIGAWQ